MTFSMMSRLSKDAAKSMRKHRLIFAVGSYPADPITGVADAGRSVSSGLPPTPRLPYVPSDERCRFRQETPPSAGTPDSAMGHVERRVISCGNVRSKRKCALRCPAAGNLSVPRPWL
jgi:hypothetical protein